MTPEEKLINELIKARDRQQAARLYAVEIRRCMALECSEFDWEKVNNYSQDRWSTAGLNYIKKLAWDRIEGSRKRRKSTTHPSERNS